MTIQSLLNSVISFGYILTEGYKINLNWLGHVVQAIIEGIGIVGLGIIVFTLVLKAITLPFDIYQRVKSRKQNLIMRKMQPELEKLQQQYANDKNMYSQKMMELYKKNGYGMLGACLPMIISFIILIVAFRAFSTYSDYANLKKYVDMVESYNAAILEYSVDGIDFTLKKAADENGNLLEDENKRPVLEKDGENFIMVWTENGETKEKPLAWEVGAQVDMGDGLTYLLTEHTEKITVGEEKKDISVKYVSVFSEDKYLQYEYCLETTKITRQYFLDTEKLLAGEGVQAKVEELIAASQENNDPEKPETLEDDLNFDSACGRYVTLIGSRAAADEFHENPPSFLWIKNVWLPDVSYDHPIPSYNSREFKTLLAKKVHFEDGTTAKFEEVMNADQFENLTRELSAEKKQPNGYFILIVLSIGLMVLSQFVMMRSQKETNKYQTVDGQGAATQKVMLVAMPLIYAVFAFMYSAAFSIYMTVSSLVSLLVTLISNFAIGRVFNKKEEELIRERYTRETPWKSGDEEKSKKTDKKGKKK